jgi:nucleotide-binding universal stress UspA family protein
MNPMRVLIAYDSSDCSREMLVDLGQAGLPDTLQADLVSFAEVWLTEPEELVARQAPIFDSDGHFDESASESAFHEAIIVSREGRDLLKEMFPAWTVTNEAHANAATWGTLECIWDWGPDLVVVGSHGRSALGRLIHGSVGQKLLAESPCSVRIARAPYGQQTGGLRILLAVDGSAESNAAVAVVASRNWPAGSSVRVIAVYDQRVMDTAAGTVTAPDLVGFEIDDIALVEERAAEALDTIRRAGLAARSIIERGNPSAAIIDTAKSWGADAIFMGARGHGLFERALIGSISNAVATRAHCSVEVVRIPGGRRDRS